jgi:adenylate kinase family enzyme
MPRRMRCRVILEKKFSTALSHEAEVGVKWKVREREPEGLMRIVVVGTSGAGKTTLARKIAAVLELQHIELDAINWQSGWRDLIRHDPEEFVRRVAEAIAAEAWVVDGNYGPVRDLVWQRATHLVWLDYERPVIMARVISRTFLRAVARMAAPQEMTTDKGKVSRHRI